MLAPYSTQSTTDGGDDSLAGESSSKKVYSLREMQQRSQPGQDEPTSRLHYDRNFITAVRAMHDFLLKPEHLAGLRVTSRRSPNDYEPPLNVYWRKDVEAKSVEVWGSREALDRERDRRTEQQQSAGGQEDFGAFFKRYLKKKRRPGPTRINRENWPVRTMAAKQTTAEGLDSQTGRVVITAVAINTFNTAAKLGAWVVTGSHAMFSEAIHSAADTANQLILVYGLRKSAKMADEKHPYGYSNMPYVSSLISGVGIFCMGAGLSIYHGAAGLMNPHSIESLTLAFVVLSASFISESITLVLAVKSIRQSAARYDMGFMEFVLGGYDPCVNVVLLEDLAAVMGVVIAGGAMGASSLLDSHIPDALGSLAIGGLLGCVATFMIYTNTTALVGRSIPEEKLVSGRLINSINNPLIIIPLFKILINRELEGDIMVRQIHDVKGIDMGNGIIRWDPINELERKKQLEYCNHKGTKPRWTSTGTNWRFTTCARTTSPSCSTR